MNSQGEETFAIFFFFDMVIILIFVGLYFAYHPPEENWIYAFEVAFSFCLGGGLGIGIQHRVFSFLYPNKKRKNVKYSSKRVIEI
jgi:hypothetical protein